MSTTLTHPQSGIDLMTEADAYRLLAFLMPRVLAGESVESVIDYARSSTNYRAIVRGSGVSDDHSGFSWNFVCGRCSHELKAYVHNVNAVKAEQAEAS